MNRPMMFITIAVLSLAAVGLGGGWWPVEASPPEAPSPAAAEPAGASGPDRVVEASPAEIEAQVQHAEAAVPHEDEADDTAQSVRKDAPGALVMADAPPPDQTQGGAIRPGDEVQPRAPILDAASTRVSFQAVLTDNVGNALAGPVNLRFQVYTSPGGVAVGAAIDLLGVPVTNGVVDTQIPIPTSSFDGTGRELGVTVNPPAAELTPRMPITAVPYAYRVDRVASAELDDSIDLGTTAVNGLLNLYRTAANTPGITLTGGASQISTFGSDGLEQIRLWGPSWGEILLMDSSALTNDRTVLLSAGNNTGGSLTLYDPSAAIPGNVYRTRFRCELYSL
jgi:hypothetical protein